MVTSTQAMASNSPSPTVLSSAEAGCAQSFEQLLADALPNLRHAALRYTKSPSLADDLVHDTVVRALRFRDKFRAGSNFKAWTYTILTNTFIHGYRRSRKEKALLCGASRSDVALELRSATSLEQASRPEQAVFAEHLSDDVVQALAALPEDFRMVVVLCDLQGQSYREVAAVLKCPLGTVMSRLHRGRRLLSDKLATFARAQGIGLVGRRGTTVGARKAS